MKYKAILFDLDGTLLNTLDDLTDATNAILGRHGYPLRSREEIRSFVGNGAAKQMARALPAGTDDVMVQQCLAEYKPYYQSHSCIKTKPYDGIMAMLEELKAAGVKLAVVSNKPDATTKDLSRRHFGELMTISLGDGMGLAKKPAPDMVHYAMKELGVTAAEAVYVGDSEVDVATAQNAGLPLIAVSWGFRGREALLKAGAHTVIDTAEALLELTR